LAEISALDIEDRGPSIEQHLADSQLLVLTQRFIDELPDRCRRVIILRKLKGLSQRDTAEKLNVTENVVEKEIALGLKTILNRLTEEGLDEGYRRNRRGSGARTRNQQGD
jgi:RNA polymerase sigma-70 factor (ECF subfamily)